MPGSPRRRRSMSQPADHSMLHAFRPRASNDRMGECQHFGAGVVSLRHSAGTRILHHSSVQYSQYRVQYCADGVVARADSGASHNHSARTFMLGCSCNTPKQCCSEFGLNFSGNLVFRYLTRHLLTTEADSDSEARVRRPGRPGLGRVVWSQPVFKPDRDPRLLSSQVLCRPPRDRAKASHGSSYISDSESESRSL